MVYCPLITNTILAKFIRIIKHDFHKRNGTFRIVWKSVARWRRLGYDGMLEWLDKEIWKIPNNQKKLEIETQAYSRWIKNREPKQFKRSFLESEILFTIVLAPQMALSNISQCVDSMMKQSYKNWELIIVSEKFDGSVCGDPRIVTLATDSTYKSSRWNFALTKAKGEWILFANENMIFSPYLLSELSAFIKKDPNVEVVYADEDSIGRHGERSNPHFKSGFNLDLFYSIPYIGEAFICKTSSINRIKGFDEQIEKCASYDLLLRMIEQTGVKKIGHISKVLFHFMTAGEDVLTRRKYRLNALKEHFMRINEKVKVSEGIGDETHRLNWPIVMPSPMVSIIIPTRDHVDILRQCIDSILKKTLYLAYEIIIVDNQSELAETLDYFEELGVHTNIKIMQFDEPFNYSAINNFGVTHSRGEIIVLLNNDVEVISPDWLNEMVSQASRSDIGCVGAMLYYPDDTIQHAGVILGLGDVAGHAHKYMRRGSSGYFNRACAVQNYGAVTAACLAVRKSVFLEVGGLNEANLTVAYNDVDLCLKVQATGYRNLWTPYAQLYHHESKSRGKDNTPEKKARYWSEVAYMKKMWGSVLVNDRYHHPAFTKTAEQFQLRRMVYDTVLSDIEKSWADQKSDYPFVNVLMATYNGAQYIQEQLDSILNQTYPYVRLVIVDDASTDDTFLILNEYAQKFPNITLDRNSTRLGYVKNFEQLIANTEGHYFALSDQDDIWELNKLAISMHAMVQKEKMFPAAAVMVHSDLELINSNGVRIHTSYFKYRGYFFHEFKDVAAMISRCGVMGNTILFNQALKKQILPFDLNVVHHDYWIAVVNELIGVRVSLKESLVKYRIHANNASEKRKLFAKNKNTDFNKLLPYRDNNRYQVLKAILSRFELNLDDKKAILIFMKYLRANKNWLKMYPIMIKEGYFSRSIYKHSKLLGRFLIASLRQKYQSRFAK